MDSFFTPDWGPFAAGQVGTLQAVLPGSTSLIFLKIGDLRYYNGQEWVDGGSDYNFQDSMQSDSPDGCGNAWSGTFYETSDMALSTRFQLGANGHITLPETPTRQM